MFRARMGKKLDLKNPKTFNEKLQWLKLYDRKPEYTRMVDKYEVKKYVADIIGQEHIIPTLGLWNDFDDIDFDTLPNKFVLKCTHDSGGLVICRNKEEFNIQAAKRKINNSLKRNFYYPGREWPYKNVKPLIIAEEYLEDAKTAELRDYKFFCFNGVAKLLFVASERNSVSETKFDFFDIDFNHLNITNGHRNADRPIQKPTNFEKMIVLAEKISKNTAQLRVDFYEVDGKVYFGEITFFHNCGFVPFVPEEWDHKLGKWIDLPKE